MSMHKATATAKPPLLVVVAGPTASGKSDLAMHLAEALGAHILVADSRQVYKGLVVGSNAPSAAEQQRVPHHLVGHVPVAESYSAARFAQEARQVLAELQHQPVVVVVAGTGFFLNALLFGPPKAPDVPPEVRRAVQQQIAERGLWSLYDELAASDPETWARIDRSNPRRVARAVEVVRYTGQPFSSFKQDQQPLYPVLGIGLHWPMPLLEERIDRRVEAMLENGLLKEARWLFDQNLPPESPALSGIGYAELAEYFLGRCSRDEAVQNIKRHTRQYAKRQYTWFRKQAYLTWHEAANAQRLNDDVLRAVRRRLTPLA